MLKLSVFMSPTGGHVGGWRLPEASVDAGLRFEPWVEFAQLAERGKFDMLFLADGNGVNGITTPELLARNPTLRPSVFEPVTLLSALASHTKNIGLVATATTTYDEPYSIARRYGSLDRLSNGRAGWNVVTSSNPEDALNFSHDSHAGFAERYERAAEFIDVTRGLWDSWADDAFLLDKDSGHFLIKGDPAYVADQMQDWYESKACDGFNIIAPYLPGGLASFVDLVVPELQARGVFRKEYEGVTLRDSLGLAHVPNARFDTPRLGS